MERRQYFDGSGLFDGLYPTARVDSTSLTTGGAGTVNVSVRYEDNAALNPATVDASDIAVLAPDGVTPLAVLSATYSHNGGGDKLPTRIDAVYTVAAPGGSWDSADNGAYTITVFGGAVSDTLGLGVPQTTGSLNVTIDPPVVPPPPPPPTDGAKPVATLTAPADITAAGAASTTVTVVYTDDTGINSSSLVTGNVVVKKGKTPLPIIGISTTPSADGKSVTAVYTVAAPGGTWDEADNGKYKIELSSQYKVTDVVGNAAEDVTGSFLVAVTPLPPPPPDVPPPPPAVNLAPTATFSPIASIDVSGTAPQTVTITYDDADGQIDAGSIGIGDILVTDAAGVPVAVTGVSITPPTNAGRISAVYTLAAPGSAWDAADNGTYTVTLAAGAVSDTAGASVAALASTFNVNVPIPQPVVDTKFSGGTPVNTGFVAEATVGTPDGKLLVVGRQGDAAAGTSQYVIKRLNADGSTDGTFGAGGVIASAVGENASAYTVVVGDDGSVYLAGTKGLDLAVWKFKPAGGLDARFGVRGEVIVDLGTDTDRALGIAVASDGSVVAVGAAGKNNAVVKLTASGARDASFGVNGVVVGSTTNNSVFGGVAVLADGRIVAAGSTGDRVVVYRFLPSGFADTSFGGNGIVRVPGLASRTDLPAGVPDHTVGVAVVGDSVLVANRTSGNFAVARLTPAGDLDLTFGTAGIAQVDYGGDDDADQILVQGSGQILVLGTTQITGQNARIGVAVLDESGALDTSFGEGGVTTVDTGVGGRALHIGDLVVRAFGAAQGNGQLVVGSGQNVNTTPAANVGLRRLNVPGSGTLGNFGNLNGRNRKLSFVDNDGSRVTLILKGGVGRALYDGSKVDLVVSGTTDSSTLQVKVVGGDGQVAIRNLSIEGAMKLLAAKAANVTGAFTLGGKLTKANVKSLEGTLAAAGGIGTLQVNGDIKGAVILAGASLGADKKLGGIGANADVFSAGSVGILKVAGAIRSSVVGAGLTSSNGTLLDDDDSIIDAASSLVGKLTARGGLDALSRIVAGAVGKAKVPGAVDVANDARFNVLST